MCTRKAQAYARIKELCKEERLSSQVVWMNTRPILSQLKDARLIRKKGQEYEDKVLRQFLILAREKLNAFQRGEGHKTGTSCQQMLKLLGTGWAAGVVDDIFEQMRNFEINNEEYIEIIKKNYYEDDQDDIIIMDELGLSRSTYFRRKREAVILFGILLWTTVRDKYVANPEYNVG